MGHGASIWHRVPLQAARPGAALWSGTPISSSHSRQTRARQSSVPQNSERLSSKRRSAKRPSSASPTPADRTSEGRPPAGLAPVAPDRIPVVDLFAGPGGLGEGFSSFQSGSAAPFDIRLSIEKDEAACATLTLRKFFRQFEEPPEEIAAYYAGEISKKELFAAYPEQAARAQLATWQAELGKEPEETVAKRVREAVGNRRDWVLLGGPPCQAYSMVGRARMTGSTKFATDHRHVLYKEYLRIVADHEPAVFVMENVKGLLTSQYEGSRIVNKIIKDLGAPGEAVGGSHNHGLKYRLYDLKKQQGSLAWAEGEITDGESYLLQAEQYGIPQNRHRLIIVGVRSGFADRPELLNYRPAVPVSAVLGDLPALRSSLSREKDSLEGWRQGIMKVEKQKWMSAAPESDLGQVAREARRVLQTLQNRELHPGAPHLKFSGVPRALGDWYRQHARDITLHETRAHMRDDLHRYLFSACFARAHHRSPKLRDFPEELYPLHDNINKAVKGNLFDDRFRVQVADRPSTTITSHVAKDGHYYIHYDPLQCRSLTVREAARLQTFPDSYYFEGTRTQQYGQVGNAVPPYLARDIAEVVFDLMQQAARGTTTVAVTPAGKKGKKSR